MNAYNNFFFKAGFSFLLISFLMYVSCFGNVASPPTPINDECSSAIQIIADTTCNYVFYSSIGATASVGIPIPGCPGYIGGDVWFSVVVPPSGRLIFDSQIGTITDGGMAIYSGNCSSLSLITCDDNSSNNGNMPFIYRAGLTPGTNIYIRFWEKLNSSGGTFGLCIYDPVIPPINDECSGAIPIVTDTICSFFTFANIGATASSNVPNPNCGNYMGGDVWFKVIVPVSGHLVFISQNQGIGNAGMAIYSGNPNLLTLISCNSTIGMPEINQSGLTPGTTIYIRFWRNLNSNFGYFNLCVYEPVIPPIQAPCTNLGFENGFNGWYGTLGNPVDGLPTASTPTYIPWAYNTTWDQNFNIMTGGNDPYGGFSVVFSGTKSLRIGDISTAMTYNAASIEQTFLVTPENTNFTYNYAVVLQNGGHAYNEQPFFQIDLFDPNENPITCGIYSVALPNSSFIQSPISSYTYYKFWTPISINLTDYLGQTVTIRFTASDCVPQAHFGYAYIDCSCSPYEIISPGTICQGQAVTLAAPVGALSYSWSPGGDTTSSITVSPLATTSYSCMIATQGNTPCYNTLTSTVTVTSSTHPIASSNSPICSGHSLQLYSSAAGANTYHWTGPNGFIDSIQNPTLFPVTNAASGTYRVTSSIGNGCIGSDSVLISLLPSIENNLNPSFCQGGSIAVGLHNYTTNGTYYDTLSSTIGCDSIITTNLIVHPSSQITLNPIICGEDAILVGTHYYSATGTYYDTLQTSYGCDSTIITHLTVLPKQQTNLNPVLCQGQTFAVGAHVYSTTGYYTDSLTTASGCDSIVITHLIVNPIPTTPVITQNNSVLTSNAPFGNQWYSQNGIMVGDTNQSLTLTSNGDYYVIVTLNGCVSDTSNVLHITNVGVGENENNSTINIYPNPVANELIIEAKGNKEKIEFEILNAIGQVVFKGSLMEKTIVQTKNFAQGMYMVKLGNGKRFEFRKVVKSN